MPAVLVLDLDGTMFTKHPGDLSPSLQRKASSIFPAALSIKPGGFIKKRDIMPIDLELFRDTFNSIYEIQQQLNAADSKTEMPLITATMSSSKYHVALIKQLFDMLYADDKRFSSGLIKMEFYNKTDLPKLEVIAGSLSEYAKSREDPIYCEQRAQMYLTQNAKALPIVVDTEKNVTVIDPRKALSMTALFPKWQKAFPNYRKLEKSDVYLMDNDEGCLNGALEANFSVIPKLATPKSRHYPCAPYVDTLQNIAFDKVKKVISAAKAEVNELLAQSPAFTADSQVLKRK